MQPEQTRANSDHESSPNPLWVLVLILLVGTFFRWSALAEMEEMLHHDEAYNGVDAVSLIRSPRLTPFFPANGGRESAWHYWLAPYIAAFGARPFALRLASTTIGILTLAAVYRLGKETLGVRGALWATTVLAVFYWHVHLSHLAFRALLMPFVGSLAFVALLRARRANTSSHWIIAGCTLGLLMHTYFSARAWIVYAFGLLIWWGLRDRTKRRGVVIAILIAILISLPILRYTYLHPVEGLNRSREVAITNVDEFLTNLGLWAGAWFNKGDSNAELNLPGRPILDPPLGALALIGLAALPRVAKRRWYGPWLLGLALFAILPSALSNYAPHFLRAAGLIVPVALVTGAGAWALERGARRIAGARLAPLLPLSALVITGIVTYRDFHVRWMDLPTTYLAMEQHINQALDFIPESVHEETPIYFTPLSPWHPNIVFADSRLMPRQVGAFDSRHCLVVHDAPAVYVSLTLYEADFRQRLSQWADTTLLDQAQQEFAEQPAYSILHALVHADALRGERVAEFGSAIRLSLLSSITLAAHPGETISGTLGLRALQAIDRPYSVFIHLHGDPTPYQGGPLWAQSDSVICESYPAPFWKLNETVLQNFALTIPPDIPPGQYVIAAGIYETPLGPRLAITAPLPQPWDYYELQEIEIK